MLKIRTRKGRFRETADRRTPKYRKTNEKNTFGQVDGRRKLKKRQKNERKEENCDKEMEKELTGNEKKLNIATDMTNSRRESEKKQKTKKKLTPHTHTHKHTQTKKN